MEQRRPDDADARWDRVVAAAVLAFALYVIAEARRMAYWQERIPGPGFAPLWLGIGLAVAAVGVLASSRPGATGRADSTRGLSDARAPGTAPPAGPSPPTSGALPAAVRGARTVVWGLAAVTVVAVALLERIGTGATLVLLLASSVRLLGGSWRTALLAAAGLTAGLVWLFGRWLQVPLPRGPWGF
ncbi:MAG: tripartite tricarboxylate transporter TctB family protein [Armatimonadota bacterium]|nr:tripartite tricarboxylate transporter TctB family protein [Armatimonadota bacterium]